MFSKRKGAQATAEAALLRSTLTAMITAAEGTESVESPLRLSKRERAIYRIDGVGLFGARHGPGQWQGRSSGVSVPVGLGIRVRVGQSRGHYVQGSERPTVIDHGTAIFTDQRVVFLGGQYTREWEFTKVLAIQHDPNSSQTAIHVSNRQKTSGFTYPSLRADVVGAWLELAIAMNSGGRDEALRQLKAQLQAVAPPPPIASDHREAPRPTDNPSEAHDQRRNGGPAAGWFNDPSGEHRLRWWDGSQWTPHTAD